MEAKVISVELENLMHGVSKEPMLLLELTTVKDDGVVTPYMRNIQPMDQVAI